MLRTRNDFALATAIGLHLLAGVLWWQDKRPRPAGEPQVVAIFLHVADRLATRPQPAPKPRPMPRRPPAASAPASHAPPAINAPAATEAAPAPVDDAPAPAPGASFDVDLVKRQGARIAGAIGRELPAARPDPNEPWTRFRSHVEAAYAGSGGVWFDSYTSPDGTIIYRKHVGDATSCRMSGSVSVLGMSAMKGVSDAGGVPCPHGVTWKREP